MIEEVDDWVGKILEVLSSGNKANNTLVVFTVDHGEMLGAHAMHGKVRLA
jgi:arylsulfatase A-like enzyme